jgi:hypothetical protein
VTNRFAVVVGSLVVLGGGCSGSNATSPLDGGGDVAGLDRTRAISTLSSADRAAFCDELAAIEGGYSEQKTLNCGGGETRTISFTIGNDQMGCETRFESQLPAGCGSVTVGDLEGCVTALYAGALCSQSTILDVAACSNWVACASGG